jgi:stress response protein YsnF
MTAEQPVTPGPEVVLHEERLDIGLERDVVRAVVRRRVVTETQSVEVTLRREVLEVEYLPATAEDDAVAPGPVPAPIVMVLSEEVPVVSTVARPYERVSIEVASIDGQQDVRATLGHEQVDIRTL